MKKISRGDFWMLEADEAWDHVNALQTELDRIELVGKQGFVPDWSKAPEWAVQYRGYWVASELPEVRLGPGEILERRPAPKTRERTKHELQTLLIHELIVAEDVAVNLEYKTLCSICDAAKISLTVTEE